MKYISKIRPKHHPRQEGFALLTAVFLCALLMLAATAVSLNVLTDSKREQEKEMIWRGSQYARAIKLYYRKNGRFPAQLDDLYKPKQGSLRFLRQPYKDPMNKQDGTWRLIYVGPAGQLIGSLKPRSNLQLPVAGTPGQPANTGAPGAPGSNPAGAPGTNPGATPGQTGTGSAAGGTGTQPGGQPGQTGTDSGAAGQGQGSQSGDAAGTGQGGQPDLPPGNVDSPSVFGGRIIGVGSKIDKRSVIVCDKAKNYRLFEFIWDPSKDASGCGQMVGTVAGGQILTAPGAPGGQPGQLGSQPGQQLNQPNLPPTANPQ